MRLGAYVGGAFFARALLAEVGGREAGAWRRAAELLLQEAVRLTHPISVALLSDLAGGHAHAPLHDLAHALATSDHAAALSAARRLSRLGHTSGWDLLSGFLTGLTPVPS